MTDAAELQSILTAWAEMIEDVQPDRRSAVAIHARAAADRIRRLERVAAAAMRLTQGLAAEPANEALSPLLLELRTALHLLDGRSTSNSGQELRRDSRRTAV